MQIPLDTELILLYSVENSFMQGLYSFDITISLTTNCLPSIM